MADVQSKPADSREIARRIRARLVRMSHDARAPHLGSAMSCVDLLVAAYWSFLDIDPTRPDDPLRDRFILSKGHAAAALYATLAERGFFSADLLETYGRDGSQLPEQMSPRCLPGVEAATGSLGHGLPLGLGMALAGRIQQQAFRVVVIVSDGECNEGSVWEAAMMAAAQQVRHLTVMIDFNRWQATGRSEEVLAISPLLEKWSAFGWHAVEIDGHDIGGITVALKHADDTPQPSAIVCRTVKGKGVSFMEDDNNWHYRIPSDEELAAALRELREL
ncbi:MAG: thiamine pyrophosphate-dependent enzyme [Planctomycetota bacterium]|nr:thiamine pyrophosphate-dependent enzyme [Planctomycetota bacterium]